MGYKSITQIILFITSVVIIFAYIQPAFLIIKDTQDEVFEYADASNKASELNGQLSKLLAIEKSFSTADMLALEAYLPSTVDEMSVMADITAMVQRNNAQVRTLKAGELQSPNENVVFAGERVKSDGASYVDFSLELGGTYEAFKDVLKSFEQNKYPLEVVSLTLGEFVADENEVSASSDSLEGLYNLVLRTYAYSSISN